MEIDPPGRPVDRDARAVGDEPGRVPDADHGRDAVFAGDDRGVGELAARVRDDGADAGQDGCPADVGEGHDEDVAGP
jgi:hypothetical protein